MSMIILLLIAIFIILVSKLARCILLNLHNIGIYSIYDLITYVKEKKWNDFDLYGIDMYVGMFGKGKTLSLVHTANSIIITVMFKSPIFITIYNISRYRTPNFINHKKSLCST